jgi:hypothetical protein
MEFENLSKSWDYTVNKAIKPKMLTLHALRELTRHLGLELELRPVVEQPVPSKKTVKGKRYIDWIWQDSKRKAVAAFEIEGANCEKTTVKEDSDSLGNIKCKFKAVLLYQVRKSVHFKSNNATINKIKAIPKENIELFFDTDFKNYKLELFKPSFQTSSLL